MMMKVLYYSEHYEGDSFISRQVEEVSEAVEVFYMCRTADPVSSRLSLNMRYLEFRESRFLTKIKRKLELSDLYINFKNKALSKSIANVANEIKPDIIHCQYGYDALKLLDNYYNPRTEFVITFRGFDASLQLILSKYIAKLKYYLSKPNVHSVFVCENLRNNLIRVGIELKGLNKVVYSNTDTTFYTRQKQDNPELPRVFTQVSNFREKKGHYYTIVAFDRFLKENPSANFVLNFIGELNEEYHQLYKRVAHLPVLSKVKFLGKKNRDEIKQVLENSHVFVHNSITSKYNDQEGIPNAIMEAMAMEMPVLATKHSGIPELLTGNEVVLLAEEKNIDEYVLNIDKIFSEGYSKVNRQRIESNFSQENFKRNILFFYKEVVSINS